MHVGVHVGSLLKWWRQGGRLEVWKCGGDGDGGVGSVGPERLGRRAGVTVCSK